MPVVALEWLNKNSQRAYPLKEDTSRKDVVSGTYTLVDDFLVDLVFVVDVNKDKRFYLRYLSILGSVVTGQIYDEDDTLAATFTVDSTTHTTYKQYSLSGAGTYEGALGKIVVGELSNLFANPQGNFEFDLAGAELEPAIVVPDIRGVASLSKKPESEGEEFAKLVGNVLIGAGFNTRVRLDKDNNCIRIDAIEGAGLGPLCDCPSDQELGPCIQTINGIPPDESFNFNVRGTGCIVITPIENGIAISNECVENCCDCEEIDDLEARVAALEGA